MEKPTLEKYGLTQKDVEYYLTQKELFENQYKKHLVINEIISFFITWIISTAIVFIIMLLADSSIFKEKEWLICITPISAFFFPTLLIFAIVDGPYKFLDRQKEIQAGYFSVELENKYLRYTNALNEYNHYLEQIDRNYWTQMTGLQFEREVASLFRNHGYDATVTSATADGGVDIVLRKNGEKIAVQCKHHAKPVGPNDVRALQGVVSSKNYSKGIFVSLNGYTSTVSYEVRSGSVQIELLELKHLLQMAKGERNTLTTKQDGKQSSPPFISKRETIIKLYERMLDEDLPQLLGKSVRHKQYGEGLIVDIIERKRIEIYFINISEQKTFVFPDAFADEYIFPVDFKLVRKEQ